MKNIIIKNTVMLYLMNIAKILFPFLTLPYLTRVLTIECYGTVAYVKSVMQYMQIIIDFGFLLSGTKDIALSNDKNSLNQEISYIFWAKMILSLLAAIALSIATFTIPILKFAILYTWLSFIVVFLTNFLFDFLFRGLEKMEIITIRFVAMKGIAMILTFVFVKGDADILWIPILDILGSSIAIFFILKELRKLQIRIKLTPISYVWYKLKDSAIYFFSNMASSAFLAMNTILIGLFLPTTDVAYWSVCLQICTAIQTMYTPLTDGIYPQMVKKRSKKIIKRALQIYIPIIICGCILLYFIATYILLIVGGVNYTEATPVLRTLIPVLFFGFLSMLFGWPSLGAIGKQKETTLTTIIAAIAQIIGVVLLIIFKSFTLINIAILRCIVEAFLALLRIGNCYRFRNLFSA